MTRQYPAGGPPTLLLTLSFCTVAALLTGCTSTRSIVESDPGVPISVASQENATAQGADTHSARARVLAEVDRWRGTRYRYGGTGKKGFDCSGFVSRVFRDALDVSLPRTTRSQMRTGASVDRNDLSFGDLVFFYTPARSDHVGIYLGSGEFAHASSSSGVMISHLDEEYWRRSYRSARRPVLIRPSAAENQLSVVDTVPAVDAVVEPAGVSAVPARRIGW